MVASKTLIVFRNHTRQNYSRFFRKIGTDDPVRGGELHRVMTACKKNRDNQLYLYTPTGETYVSQLLRVQADSLHIDRFVSREARDFFQRYTPLVFSFRLDDIDYYFESTAVKECLEDRGRFYVLTKPATLYKQQRREFYRVTVPLAAPITFGDRSVRDISGGGIGFICPESLQIGLEFRDVVIDLVLPKGYAYPNGESRASARIRSAVIVRALPLPDKPGLIFYGAKFARIDDGERQKVLAYVNVIDRRERSMRDMGELAGSVLRPA